MSKSNAAAETVVVEAAEVVQTSNNKGAMIPALVQEHYKFLFGKPAGKAKLETLVSKIEAEYARKQKEEGVNLAICGTCSAKSDANLDECPLCGASEVEEGSEAPTPAQPKGITAFLASAKDVVEPAAHLTEDDLNKAVAEFQSKQSQVASNYWELGQMLARIKSGGLYRLRMNADGKAAYMSFEQFAKAEIGWNRKSAYQAIGVSERFTPKQIAEVGHAKLGLIVNLPDEHRERLANEASTKSKADLEKEVTELRSDGTETPKNKKVTLVIEDERIHVQLFAKAKNEETGEHERALSLEDLPWGTFETVNGVTMNFTITVVAGGKLGIIIETAR